MKTRHFLLFTTLLSTPLVFTTALPAQSATPAGAGELIWTRTAGARPFGPLFRTLDTDRDGTLSGDELRFAPIALTAFDLDDDGALARNEIGPGSMAHARRIVWRGMVTASPRSVADAALMLVLDANNDGVVQPIEVANAASSLRRLDRNGDGAITPDELRAVFASDDVGSV